MAMTDTYAATAPAREEIDSLAGPAVVEFGANWCGFCIRAQPLVAEAFSACPQVRHIKIEDGPGKRLGRAFKVKLWPTLIFLRDGQEIARVVRPEDVEEIRQALAKIVPAG